MKRATFLHSFTSDHHHGLVFCSRLKRGIAKNIAPERLKNYINWFWNTELKEHFEMEEKYLIPILGIPQEQIQQTLNEHTELKTLFHQENYTVQTFEKIVQLLESHIRFEENTLFNSVENYAQAHQIEQIQQEYPKKTEIAQWNDPFWQE